MSHAGLQLLGGLPSCRLLTCHRRSRSSCCAPKPRQSVLTAARRGQFESDWEKEFAPGDRLAKRSQLEFEQIQSSSSSSSVDSSSFDVNSSFDGEVECEFNGSQAPANQSIMHKLFGRHWEELPAKYKLVFATSMAFVLCNMDKVNISVAIIPMAEDFGWSSTVSGLVQSSFFFGYMLSQIPGGYIIAKKGGRKVLPIGVGLWSLATAAVPVMAGTMPGLFLSRAAVGLGEGVAPSSATDMVARLISQDERSRAMSFIFGGLPVGSLLGLFVAPPLIERFGWPTVFYAFGLLGLAWAVWFEHIQTGIAAKEPEVAAKLQGYQQHSGPAGKLDASGQQPVPWRGFLRNRPVQALAYTHFCNNWFHYTMMAWLPSYFADTLSLSLTQAAQLSLLPPVAAIIASSIAGTAGDALISKGMPVLRVRKLAQCTAFLGPALCLAGASLTDDSHLKVGLITAALGLASFSLAGLYCNHADLSPRYAPVLLGLTNTTGAIPGIIGVTITGAILDKTGSWPLALFVPTIVFFVTGSVVFAAFGSSDLQSFENDAPFAAEKYAQPLYKQLGRAKQFGGGLAASVPKLDGHRVDALVSKVKGFLKQKQS
ncbi:hypothetical protein ABBQ38_012724 [Trebouxia sp. C0009 RCD-2024]